MPIPAGSTAPQYRTSSFSDSVNCVEVRLEPHGTTVSVRDTKDRTRPPVTFSAIRWRMFVTSLRSGEFERQ